MSRANSGREAIGARTMAIVGEWERRPDWARPNDSHTYVEIYAGGWAWSVPVSRRRRQVTVMLDTSRTRVAHGHRMPRTYREELARTSMMRAMIERARPIGAPWGRSRWTPPPWWPDLSAATRSSVPRSGAPQSRPPSSRRSPFRGEHPWWSRCDGATSRVAPTREPAAVWIRARRCSWQLSTHRGLAAVNASAYAPWWPVVFPCSSGRVVSESGATLPQAVEALLCRLQQALGALILCGE